MRKTLNYGMVGGSLGAFIGDVHRKAADFDKQAVLSAGCFSSRQEMNRETGEFYGIENDRIYDSYKEMAEKESQRLDGIDFVTITTPNNMHYQVAKLFLEKGIHVLCEKPLCFKVEEAEELKRVSEEKGLLFAVNYSYSGNNMVKEARELILKGHMNGLVVRIFGTKGAIEWQQENPDVLYVTLKGQPTQIYNRGMAYVPKRASEINRIPSEHPEGLYAAFANIYKAWTSAVLKKVNNEELSVCDYDFPNIDAGISGMKFIYACVESSKKDSVWVRV